VKTYNEIIETRKSSIKPLPITHSTTITKLKKILSLGKLETSHCKVFKEDLLYLFYGRADFEPGSILNNHGMLNEMPATIVIDYDNFNEPIKRLLPFDTGALWDGKYQKWFGTLSADDAAKVSKVNELLKDYYINPKKEMLCKFVESYYRTNHNFYHRTMKPFDDVLEVLEGKTYFDGVSSKIGDETDGRSGAIEIQLASGVEINSTSVKTIVLPNNITADISSEITGKSIIPIYYSCVSKTNISYNMGNINGELFRYLQNEALV